MKRGLLLTGVIIALLIGGLFLTRFFQKPEPVFCTQDAKQCPDGGYVGRVAPKCEFAPCPVRQANIRVYEPVGNQSVTQPLVLVGEAREFENTFNFRLRDEKGNVRAEGFATAQAPDVGTFGPFSVLVRYDAAAGIKKGTLEVFAHSMKDGAQIDTVTVPVQLGKTDGTVVETFFNNSHIDPQSFACEKVYSVVRVVPQTTGVARAALEQLFAGPTAAEAQAGYISMINPGVKIQKLTIENGVAKLDLNQAFSQGLAGSCRVSAIRAQIERTLKLFPTVKTVIISVDGQTENVLQP